MNGSPVSIAELSRRLQLPIRWIKAEALAGRLPHLRVGRRWLFNEVAVRAFLAQRAAREGVRDG